MYPENTTASNVAFDPRFCTADGTVLTSTGTITTHSNLYYDYPTFDDYTIQIRTDTSDTYDGLVHNTGFQYRYPPYNASDDQLVLMNIRKELWNRLCNAGITNEKLRELFNRLCELLIDQNNADVLEAAYGESDELDDFLMEFIQKR